MTVAVDTSVVVAAFGEWHEAHEAAKRIVDQPASIPAHCALEAYSTLTRLPEPFRAPAPVVAEYLRRRFADRWLFPDRNTLVTLTRTLADRRIVGGSAYDGLVAATARDGGAVLWTLDERAERTYRLMGVDYRLVDPAGS